MLKSEISGSARLSARVVNHHTEWNSLIGKLPHNHILQCWEWGALKARHGWKAQRLIWEVSDQPVAAAQLLVRTVRRMGLTARMMYAPRGPLLDWNNQELCGRVLRDMQTHARQAGVLFLKIDPEIPVGYGVPKTEYACANPTGMETSAWLTDNGWRCSTEQVQFRNTVVIELTRSEDEILASLKQKTRYNIRLATRKGVAVRAGYPTDIDTLHRMYVGTSMRDGFAIREADYYHDSWASLMQKGLAQPLVAEFGEEPVAGAIIFAFDQRAYYMYGMSSNAHRDKMPNHLLQWEAIRWAKTQGCTTYDLWGAPDVFEESDPMWGVWRFKAGFGGKVLRTIGAWDLPINHLGYRIYTGIMPKVLRMMRRRGMRRVLLTDY